MRSEEGIRYSHRGKKGERKEEGKKKNRFFPLPQRKEEGELHVLCCASIFLPEHGSKKKRKGGEEGEGSRTRFALRSFQVAGREKKKGKGGKRKSCGIEVVGSSHHHHCLLGHHCLFVKEKGKKKRGRKEGDKQPNGVTLESCLSTFPGRGGKKKKRLEPV